MYFDADSVGRQERFGARWWSTFWWAALVLAAAVPAALASLVRTVHDHLSQQYHQSMTLDENGA